ncbi:MAG: ABC transporter permease, partial [Candidatus Diapherotrites archaeon]|nr:ABC transporter permease [Candidatus Diapherotrites archaeon]
MNAELFEVAAKNLRRQGVRTYLTLIGIVIGIAAIVALLSIGQGLNVAVTQQFEQLGSNTIFVIPISIQGSESAEIKDSDISRIEAYKGVEIVVPIYASSAILEYANSKVTVSISAADADKAMIFEDTGFFDVKEGRMLTKSDSSAVVIGQRIAEDYFEKEIRLRKKVLINGKSYRVVGILAAASQTIGGGGPDPG